MKNTQSLQKVKLTRVKWLIHSLPYEYCISYVRCAVHIVVYIVLYYSV